MKVRSEVTRERGVALVQLSVYFELHRKGAIPPVTLLFSASLGLWTIRIDVVNVSGVLQFRRHMPLPVIQLGQAAPEVFGEDFGTITSIALHDPIAAGPANPPAVPAGLSEDTLRALDSGRHELDSS